MTDEQNKIVSLGRRLIELRKQRAEAEAVVDEIKGEAGIVEQALLAEFEHGVDKISVDGVTLSPRVRKTVRAVDGNRLAVVEALERCGRRELVNFNTQTLSAYIRDEEENGRELPLELASVIQVGEIYSVGLRKS